MCRPHEHRNRKEVKKQPAKAAQQKQKANSSNCDGTAMRTAKYKNTGHNCCGVLKYKRNGAVIMVTYEDGDDDDIGEFSAFSR